MFKHFKKDLPASIVVFFVALPLCLGIALASGAPLFSGLIAGMVGGIIVGSLSGSSLGVSGPAAGLAVIVLGAIASLGSFENFLLAVVLGGAIQIVLGFARAGIIAYYFPSSVIKGMLAGIGITIILQQIPYAFGFDKAAVAAAGGLFSNFGNVFDFVTPGALLITVLSLAILLLWDKVLAPKSKIFKVVPGPVVAVVAGVLIQMASTGTALGVPAAQLVKVPVPDSAASFFGQFSFPNFAMITNPEIWVVAVTLAIVASLETLLSVEAIDKLDPLKRVTPTNRELFAQGAGNMVSGLIGGLPVTQVIVRSSANVQSGGRTKMSAIMHGLFILLSIIVIPKLLNLIPLAVLAAVLLLVGFKLAKPALFLGMSTLGKSQFLPFLITVLGVVFTDLLTGIGLGLLIGVSVILINSYKNSHFLHKEGFENSDGKYKITLAEEVTFLNKGAILKELNAVPRDAFIEIDVSKTKVLDYDILEILDEFAIKAKHRNIDIRLVSSKGVVENPDSYRKFFGLDVAV